MIKSRGDLLVHPLLSLSGLYYKQYGIQPFLNGFLFALVALPKSVIAVCLAGLVGRCENCAFITLKHLQTFSHDSIYPV